VDRDPVGSETVSKILIRKNHFRSGQLRIRNVFEVKLLRTNFKLDYLLTKKCHKKYKYFFDTRKIFAKKFTSRPNPQPNTLTDRKIKVKFMVILEHIHVGSEYESGSKTN
jgi:hypothetical protein